MHATIYHNPDCGTSRNTLAMLLQAGVDTTVVRYLDTPPDADRLRELLSLTGLSPRELLRRKGTPHDDAGDVPRRALLARHGRRGRAARSR